MSNFMEICPVGAELFHVDGQTDGWTDRHDELFLISNFRHVLNAVCFLVGNSPASEFYMLTFWNTVCSIFIGG